MHYKTDSDPLNRLQAMIQINAHLLSEIDVREFNSIYSELVSEYHSYENEISMNEQLLSEIAALKTKTRMGILK